MLLASNGKGRASHSGMVLRIGTALRMLGYDLLSLPYLVLSGSGLRS